VGDSLRRSVIWWLHAERGVAEYLLADPNYVAHIPKGLGSKEAAPLICAGITTYKGIKETQARPGEWIAISGCGGLGHLQVCAVDIDDGKLEHAICHAPPLPVIRLVAITLQN
jgi:Zn-dependent alcohol dehydrogenase